MNKVIDIIGKVSPSESLQAGDNVHRARHVDPEPCV